MRPIVLDSGAFIAARSYLPDLMAYVKAAERTDVSLYVSAAVIAEVWRDPAPMNAAKLLGGATVIPLDLARSRKVGLLLGATRTAQLVDSAVAALAIELLPSIVLTSDLADIERLVRAGGVSCNLRTVGKSDVIVASI